MLNSLELTKCWRNVGEFLSSCPGISQNNIGRIFLEFDAFSAVPSRQNKYYTGVHATFCLKKITTASCRSTWYAPSYHRWPSARGHPSRPSRGPWARPLLWRATNTDRQSDRDPTTFSKMFPDDVPNAITAVLNRFRDKWSCSRRWDIQTSWTSRHANIRIFICPGPARSFRL